MTHTNTPPGEERLITDYFAPLARDWPGAFGLRDDCASVEPAPGQEIVIKTDPVRAGVHFFPDDAPADIAWKALAVNISDLAAKSARPLGYLLAVSFPEKPTDVWLRAFAEGLREAQDAFGCTLIGGDTDRADGPMTLAVTVLGECPVGGMVRRDTARSGDVLYVSGTLGDAALGLAIHGGAEEVAGWNLSDAELRLLRRRYLRPEPRLGLKAALRNFARASMDLSDGLAKDLGRMCRASGCGADVDTALLPRSAAMQSVLSLHPKAVECMISAGDDYEILAAVAPENMEAFERSAKAGAIPVRRIGHLHTRGDVRFFGPDGQPMLLRHTGYDHF
jgi:thiamine-monophosphate kinase